MNTLECSFFPTQRWLTTLGAVEERDFLTQDELASASKVKTMIDEKHLHHTNNWADLLSTQNDKTHNVYAFSQRLFVWIFFSFQALDILDRNAKAVTRHLFSAVLHAQLLGKYDDGEGRKGRNFSSAKGRRRGGYLPSF